MAEETGAWDAALAQLREWDPAWAETCTRMVTNPWQSDVLPRKLVELIGIALNAACTNLNPEGTRRHIRRALDAGATRDEILMILKMASVMSIHSCSLGAPILLEEAKSAGAELQPKAAAPTPAIDKIKSIGQWNAAWDPFFELDPGWTDQFMATGVGIYASGCCRRRRSRAAEHRLRCVVHPHVRAGTRRHVQQRARAGATMEEIMEVLKLCVAQGVQACNLGVPILAEELARAR